MPHRQGKIKKPSKNLPGNSLNFIKNMTDKPTLPVN